MMTAVSVSAAVRLMRSKGFLAAEALIAVFVLSLLTSLTLQYREQTKDTRKLFPDEYLRIQSESILTGREHTMFMEPDIRVHFNGQGNVDQAKTLYFTRHGHSRRIIIELGGGRLVIPD